MEVGRSYMSGHSRPAPDQLELDRVEEEERKVREPKVQESASSTSKAQEKFAAISMLRAVAHSRRATTGEPEPKIIEVPAPKPPMEDAEMQTDPPPVIKCEDAETETFSPALEDQTTQTIKEEKKGMKVQSTQTER